MLQQSGSTPHCSKRPLWIFSHTQREMCWSINGPECRLQSGTRTKALGPAVLCNLVQRFACLMFLPSCYTFGTETRATLTVNGAKRPTNCHEMFAGIGCLPVTRHSTFPPYLRGTFTQIFDCLDLHQNKTGEKLNRGWHTLILMFERSQSYLKTKLTVLFFRPSRDKLLMTPFKI